jgi:hypothetical protein
MSEILDNRPAELAPDTIIELADLTELPAFEDAIAPLVKPIYDPELWAARSKIDERLRPKVNGRLFYGRLGDITLTVMPEAYERLLDARERGWQFSSKNWVNTRADKLPEQVTDHYLGLVMTANAYSSGRGHIGAVEAELWYFPPAQYIEARAGQTIKGQHIRKNGQVAHYNSVARIDWIKDSGVAVGETIRRLITKPKYEAGRFVELDESSRRIGTQVLIAAMKHPLPGTVRS